MRWHLSKTRPTEFVHQQMQLWILYRISKIYHLTFTQNEKQHAYPLPNREFWNSALIYVVFAAEQVVWADVMWIILWLWKKSRIKSDTNLLLWITEWWHIAARSTAPHTLIWLSQDPKHWIFSCRAFQLIIICITLWNRVYNVN